MIKTNYQKRLTSFWLGRKCVFCGKRKVCHTSRGYIKCLSCKRQKSLKRLRRELLVLLGFVEQRPAYQVAVEYGLSLPGSFPGLPRDPDSPLPSMRVGREK